MKLAVAGTGYVGLSNAILLAQNNAVYAVDILPQKVEMINNRKSPIVDSEIEEYLRDKELNLTATTNAAEAYTNADFIIISTPTNYDPKLNYFDTSSVESVIEQVLEINPDANIEVYKEFYLADSEIDVITQDLSYAVDCVDTILAKIAIICNCDALNIPVISSMGTGNKLDPSMFEISDIYDTSVCPLARIMKKDLKKRNIDKLKVVYSKEHPINTNDAAINQDRKYKVKGSVSFVPSVAGLMIAGEVIKDIAGA